MGEHEHLVLCVDRLVLPEAELAVLEPSSREEEREEDKADEGKECCGGEEEPLIEGAECRICQEEDSVANLEVPCACSGSLKYAHRKCVQRWCNEKGDITCEICHQSYQPGYTAPPPPSPRAEEATIEIGTAWTISGAPLDLHNPRLLAIAQVERPFFETDYDDYAASGARAAAFCRSALLIMMALLFLRHAWIASDNDEDDDDDNMSAIFSALAARAAGFLLPCYVITWAINILHRRWQRQGVYLKK
uniref:RING-CH-type domain-containing protein n=1 Tax=Opuntia streptacantha TaxID=393608 RepID=A0A7C9A5J8_OPUST